MASKLVRKADVYKHGGAIGGMLAGLMQTVAAIAISAPAVAALTDSSTGTASVANPPSVATMALPSAFTHVTGSDLAPKAGFDTAMTASYDAAKAFAEWLNTIRGRLDLPLITYTGTPGTSGTISAQTKALTGVDGTGANAVAAASGIAQLKIARDNLRTLLKAANEVLNAVGATPISRYQPGNDGLALTANSATAAGVSGASNAQSLSDAAVDTLLGQFADAYATLAARVTAATTAASRSKPKFVYIGDKN